MGTEWAYQELSGAIGWKPPDDGDGGLLGGELQDTDHPLPTLSRKYNRTQRTRRESYPEYTTFTDDGCDLFAACLSCPLPACRFEMPPGRARAYMQAAALERLLRGGGTMDEAAVELGLSRRTLYRLRRIAVPMADAGAVTR